MSLVTNEYRDQIIAGIESVYGFTFTPAQKIEAQKLWGVVEAALYNSLINKVNLVLASVKVNPGTFTADLFTGVVTGQGDTVAGTQNGPGRIS